MIANIGQSSYPLYIASGALSQVGKQISDKFPSSKVVLISDKKVYSLYGEKVIKNIAAQGIVVNSIVVEQGEKSKSLNTMEYVLNKLVEYKTSRTDIIVALGGGVVGDLGGFVASCYLRGIEYIQIPTSLLAQVDSSIGGKTAINLPQGKNLVGTFYHPSMVIIDVDVLQTLDDLNFACGMAEIIKTALIMDKDLFSILKKYSSREKIQSVLPDVITTCCKNKLYVVQQDEKDNGLRLTLNFGHTLAHALEKCDGIHISHGHAVAIGMAVITKSSQEMSQTKQGTYKEIVSMLDSFSLPHISPDVDMQKVLQYAQRDKKTFNSKLKLILLKDVGECFIHPVSYDKLPQYIINNK